MHHTTNLKTDLFVPPAAEGLPLAALDSATVGADRLDAAALTPAGRNFLAHALVQLARDGWLRAEPGEGFEPVRDREAPEPAASPSAVVSADRATLLREAADQLVSMVQESFRTRAVDAARPGLLTAIEHLRRVAAEEQPAETQRPSCPDPIECGHEAALGQAQATVERVRTVLETEAVVGRSALEYRGLILSALMADEAQQDGAQPC